MKKIEVGCNVMFLENEQIEMARWTLKSVYLWIFLAAAGSTAAVLLAHPASYENEGGGSGIVRKMEHCVEGGVWRSITFEFDQ